MVATADAAAPYASVDPTKVGYGVATLWLAPSATALPADTVSMGTSWGGSWSAIGATDDGVHYGFTATTNDLPIEESPLPAAVLQASADFPITVTLSEDTIANIKTASGAGSIAVQAAGVGAVGKSTLTFSTLLNSMALGVEHANPLGHWRRVYVPNVVAVSGWTADNRRAAGKRMYAVTFRAVCLPSQILIVEKTAESTG